MIVSYIIRNRITYMYMYFTIAATEQVATNPSPPRKLPIFEAAVSIGKVR